MPPVQAKQRTPPVAAFTSPRPFTRRRIGEKMGQRSKIVTADIYTHALIDACEVDRPKLLERVTDARAVRSPVRSRALELAL